MRASIYINARHPIFSEVAFPRLKMACYPHPRFRVRFSPIVFGQFAADYPTTESHKMRENAVGETISAAFKSMSNKQSKSDFPKFDFENLQRNMKQGVLFRRLRGWPVVLVPS